MNTPKNISDLSYKELGELYIAKSKELEKLMPDDINYNFVQKQLELIEEAINIKSGNKSGGEIFVKVTEKAKELGVNPRTIKNWIISGKVEGKIIDNKYRKTWLVINDIVLEEIKEKNKEEYVKRQRDSKGHFTKNG